MDADILRGRDVTACYERHVRAEDGQRFLLCAVRGSVKKRGWVREELVGELFPRVARRARAGAFHQKPAGQKPRPPVAGQDEIHVAVRLSVAAHGPAAGPTSFALGPTSFAPGACCLLCGQPLPAQTQAQQVKWAQTKWEDGDEWRIVRSHTEAAEAHTETDSHTEEAEASGGTAKMDIAEGAGHPTRGVLLGGGAPQYGMTLDEMLEAIRE